MKIKEELRRIRSMKQRIFSTMIAIVMLFAVAGLAACELNNPTLAEYQAAARVDLTNYAESRGQTNFTTENWTVIQGHVTTGKAAIDEAIKKAGVRTARDTAKAAVGAVPRKNNEGSYIRHLNSDLRIKAQMENQIRLDYLVEFDLPNDIKFGDVFIPYYFGTYSGSVAVIITAGLDYEDIGLSTEVAGINFGQHGLPFILIWNDGNFYQLNEAYDQKLLTLNNIENIRYYWQPFFVA